MLVQSTLHRVGRRKRGGQPPGLLPRRAGTEFSSNKPCTLQLLILDRQVLNGDVAGAVETHSAFYALWKRYGSMPESYNIKQGSHASLRSCHQFLLPWLNSKLLRRHAATQDNRHDTSTRAILCDPSLLRVPSCSTTPHGTRFTLKSASRSSTTCSAQGPTVGLPLWQVCLRGLCV
jgi:hypothetical protein